MRAAAAFALAATLAACAGAASDTAASSADITNVPETAVRNQKDTGNCWLFATAAWAESLELSARIQQGTAQANNPASAPPHFSPAYWDYWDWYTTITTGKIKGTRTLQGMRDLLDAGGSWGAAAELIARYGLQRTEDFLGRGANRDADVAEKALDAMAHALASGDLHTVDARKDRRRVRKALDAAFGLDDAHSAALDAVFGDGQKTLTDGAVASGPVIDPAHLTVRLPKPDGTSALRPLSDAIGARKPGDDPDARVGTWAWNVTPFDASASPSELRGYFRRIQRALHAGVPLPISWYDASNADPDDTGSFTTTPTTTADADDSGGHETLLDDYEVDDVPGYGRLAAGEHATAAQEEAALADDAKIVFLRVKNSWGGKSGAAPAPKGYNDLYVQYLEGKIRVCPKGEKPTSAKCTDEIPLEDVTLPAGF